METATAGTSELRLPFVVTHGFLHVHRVGKHLKIAVPTQGHHSYLRQCEEHR